MTHNTSVPPLISTRPGVPITAPGAPFTWRGQRMEAVRSMGGLSAGLVWLVRCKDRTPVATVRRGEITPTGYVPLDAEGAAELLAACRALIPPQEAA